MKLIKTIALVALVGFLSSCGNYTEEFTIKSDGSGKYNVYTDVITGGIEMSVKMAQMFVPDSLTPQQQDSLREVVEAKVWEDFPGYMDSTIDMMSEMPDSMLNYGNNRAIFEKARAYMKGGQDSNYVYAGMEYPFANGDEFIEFMKFVEENQNKDDGGGAGPGSIGALSKTKTSSEFVISKKKFSRNTIYTKPEGGDESLDKIGKMFGEGTYRTVIRTERKIKKVTGENIKEQSDYMVVFEYDFMEALSGNVNTDFEIILK